MPRCSRPASRPGGHTIEHSEFILVTEGTLEVTYDGRSERAGPGSVIYIAHGTMHQARNVGPGPVKHGDRHRWQRRRSRSFEHGA